MTSNEQQQAEIARERMANPKYDRCACGSSKLARLSECHECHLRLSGKRRTTSVHIDWRGMQDRAG